MENYILKHYLGSGRTSDVYLAENTKINVPVAVKLIDKNNLSDKQLQHVRREISLMKSIEHENIIKLFDVIEGEEKIALIMEYALKGQLNTYLKTEEKSHKINIKKFFAEIISAVEYLHEEKHIIHRDIKPQNILVDRFSRIKLADFGLSTLEDSINNTRCGSPGYTSPEMLLKQDYGPATDIWSLGVVLYVMCFGVLPFHDSSVQNVCKKIISDPVKIPDDADPQLSDLIQRMLEKDQTKRISLNDVKMHPWLNYDEIMNGIKREHNRVNKEQIVRRVMAKLNSLGYTSEFVYANIEKEDNEIKVLFNLLRWKYESEKIRKMNSSTHASKALETGRLFIGLGSKVKCYRRRENIK